MTDVENIFDDDTLLHDLLANVFGCTQEIGQRAIDRVRFLLIMQALILTYDQIFEMCANFALGLLEEEDEEEEEE